MMATIPLEDNFEDILAKSMRGHRISETILAERTGIPTDVLARLCRGEFCDEAALRKVATVLSLDPQALSIAAAKAWYPRSQSVEGLESFNQPYRDMYVNAYLVHDPESQEAAFFDTGTSGKVLIDRASEQGVTVRHLFITHTHGDHIAALVELQAAFPDAIVRCNRAEPCSGAELFSEGDGFALGGLRIRTLTTSGHSKGGTSYVVEGLAKPLVVVGDSIFAGSMGGGMVCYDDARTNNREKILTLPEETVICPGHGPLTTVGEEKRHNPFFASEFVG